MDLLMRTRIGRRKRAQHVVLGAICLAAAVGCGDRPPQLVRVPADPPAALWIGNVDVFDSVNGRMERGRDVLVRGAVIDTVTEAGTLAAPADAERIDGSGATLLPGLIDAHAHVSSSPMPPWKLALPDVETNLRAFLYCGVTTLLDPGESDAAAAAARRDRIARGELLGPHVYTAGKFITARGGHPVAMASSILPWWLGWYVLPRIAHEVTTVDEARAAANAVADADADILKIIIDSVPEEAPRLTAELAAAAVAQAKARGLRTVSHIGDYEDAIDAAEAGIAAWVHGVYKEPIDADQVARLASYDIPMVVTLTVFDNYATSLDGNRLATRLERETAPPEVFEALNDVPADHPVIETFRPYLEMLARNRSSGPDNARRLYDAGVTIMAGSDPQTGVFSGAGLHRELAALARAGIPNAAVLQSATIHPARFLTQESAPDFGIVAAGKRADLLLVDGDPIADISAVSEIRDVILGGIRLERKAVGTR